MEDARNEGLGATEGAPAPAQPELSIETLQAEIAAIRSERDAVAARLDGFASEHEALVAANEAARRALAGRLRESFLASDPALDPEMVQGETLEELEASFASAQAVVAKVREAVRREQVQRVPIGAPGRTRTGPASPLEKIRLGLAGLAS